MGEFPCKEAQFKKGQSGNPKGRPRKLVSKLKIDGYHMQDIQTTFLNMLTMRLDEMKKIFDNPKSTILEKTVASALKKSIEKGNLESIETLINRAIGKPTETMNNQGDIKIKVSYDRKGDSDLSE